MRRLVQSGLGYGAAIATANGLGAVFQFSLARILSPGDYSLLATLLTVVMIIGVPLGAVQAAVARDVAARLKEGDPAEAGLVLRETGRAIARLLPLAALGSVVVGLPLALVLNVQNVEPLIGTAITLGCSLAFPVVWGGIQGMTRFRTLGLAQLGYAALKLALGVLLAAVGAGVTGVMLGVGTASVATLAATSVVVLPLMRAAAAVPRTRRPLLTRYHVAAAVILGSFAVLTTVDIVVARLSFPPPLAGAYAAASIGARALLLIASVAATVLFPHVATLRDPRRERRFLLGGSAAVLSVVTPFVAVYWLWPHAVLAVTFGQSYAPARHWLGPLALAMALYAVATVYQFHFLSLGRTRYALLVVPIVAVQIALFAAFHARPGELVAIQVAVAGLLVLASESFEQVALRHWTDGT